MMLGIHVPGAAVAVERSSDDIIDNNDKMKNAKWRECGECLVRESNKNVAEWVKYCVLWDFKLKKRETPSGQNFRMWRNGLSIVFCGILN